MRWILALGPLLLLVPDAVAVQERFAAERRDGILLAGAASGAHAWAWGDTRHVFEVGPEYGWIVAEARAHDGTPLTLALAAGGDVASVAHASGQVALVRWDTGGAGTPWTVHVHADDALPSGPRPYEVVVSRFRSEVRPAQDYSWFEGRLTTEERSAGLVAWAPIGTGPGWGPATVAAVALLTVWAGLRHRVVVAGWLFSRIARQRLLDCPQRSAIHALVEARGSVRIEEARSATGLSNGAFRHHVRFLLGAGLVRRVRCGNATWLTTPGQEPGPDLPGQVLRFVHARPGAQAAEVAGAFGLSPAAARYHLRSLRRSRRLLARHENGVRRWFPADKP